MNIVLKVWENSHGKVCIEFLIKVVAYEYGFSKKFGKIPTAKSALKFALKLSPTNMGFLNYSVLKYSLDFQNTEKSFLEVFYKSSCSSLINTVMKYLNFRSNGSKLESVIWKFTKNRTPSQVFSKNSYIENCLSMAASEEKIIMEIFLNGCFSKTAAKTYLSYKF